MRHRRGFALRRGIPGKQDEMKTGKSRKGEKATEERTAGLAISKCVQSYQTVPSAVAPRQRKGQEFVTNPLSH